MIDLLETSQVAVNVRFYYRGTPYQDDTVAAQEVAIARIRDIVEVLRRHAIILTRLLEALFLKDPSYQSILKVHEL